LQNRSYLITGQVQPCRERIVELLTPLSETGTNDTKETPGVLHGQGQIIVTINVDYG
jgi:hypothetical protein